MAQALKLSAGGANLILGAGFSGRSVPTPGSSASATINIERRSVTEVAPEALIFSISLTDFDTSGPGAGEIYDPRLHDIYYFWDFDDSYTFTAPENIPTAHKEANLAYGPKAAHTFRAAGTYTVTCLVVEPASGKSATASLDVTVGDPDTEFSEANTIFLSPTSDWTDAPAGAQQVPDGDLDAAISTYALGQGTGKRFMLNRGEAFTCSGTGQMGNGSTVPTLHIVAGGGAGANPTLSMTGRMEWNDKSISSGASTKDWVIQNIDMTGSFDSATNTGTKIDCIATNQSPPNLLLLDGCSMDGFDHCIFNNGADTNVDGRCTVVNDSVITNYSEWGFADSSKFATALVGSRLMSKVDALVDSTVNGGSPYRTGGTNRLTIISSCDFFSRQGWSGDGSLFAMQASARGNSEGYEGAEFYCTASAFEGGRDCISLGSAEGSPERAMNTLIDKCILTGSFQSPNLIPISLGGASIRSNIMIVSDATRTGGVSNPAEFVGEENRGAGDATNAAAPVRVYNNSMVNLYSGSAAISETDNDYFTNLTNANNLVHQPNATSGSTTADGPLTTTELWSPRMANYEDSGQGPLAGTATPAGTISLYRIGTGSGAYQDATTGLVAYDDFFGDVRGANPSRGALEPA